MKRNWIVMGLLVLTGFAAHAADSFIKKVDFATQTQFNMKIRDLGDGTFGEVTSDIGAPSPTSTYQVRFASSTSAPLSLSPTGVGLTWGVEIFGGSATFNLNGGDEIAVESGKSITGDFQGLVTNPVINLTFLQEGATAHLILEMAE